MRHFPLTTHKNKWYFRSWYPYLQRLDQELASIQSFIDWQSPNYHILNYTTNTEGSFYTTEELFDKHILVKACIYDAAQDLPTEPTATSLLVLPSHLSYHQGILNNFTGYHSIWLVFMAYADLIKIDGITLLNDILMIPDFLVPTSSFLGSGMSTQITRIVPSDFANDTDIQEDPNNEFGVSGLDYKTWRFVSPAEESEQILTNTLIYNQYRLISYEDTMSLLEKSVFQPFEEAHFIISQAKAENNLDNSQAPSRLDPANYLYCRLAGSSPYYKLFVNNFTYTERAAAKYGNNNILIWTSQPIRIALTTPWFRDILTNSVSWMAYELPYRGILMNQFGTPWLGDTNISHHISLETSINTHVISEEIFTEHFDQIESFSFEKNKIPYYTININEGSTLKNIETENASMMVSIW